MDETVTELVQSLLKERYQQGHDAGHDEGWRLGYERAMAELRDFLGAGTADDANVRIRASARTGRERRAGTWTEKHDAASTEPPYIKRAIAFLAENPGARYSDAVAALNNNNVLYTLVKKGYAENRDGEFYLK